MDGPNNVDWIFHNSIHTERERELYVDYVRDIAEEDGGCFWTEPSTSDDPGSLSYRPSETLGLCRALCDIGATSPGGLAVIADAWKDFKPEKDTCRSEIYTIIKTMLSRLEACEYFTADGDTMSQVVRYWTFPLWTLSPIKLDDSTPIQELRIERRKTIQWIHQKEARRDPPPNITRDKVKALHQLYLEWRREVKEDYARKHPDSAKLAACRTEVRENGCGRIAMWRGHGIERLS